ncbi:MAG: CbbX protein [Acidimicrobiales bacterium]
MADEEEQKSRGFAMPTGRQQPGAGSSGDDDEDEDEPKEELLGDDDTVDVGAERKQTHADEVLERLDHELVGLAPVKTRINEIADLLVVDRLRRRFGIDSTRPTLHMSFTGSPGTGKTTVALRMAELLKGMGYLAKGHLVNVTRDDLVGQYIGHTAPKTREVLKRAMGGVLFIDEAYYLYRQENERDYGQETIEILLQIMENQREDLVVILAGYKDRMDVFFQSNPGMGSRIAHHIDFPDYTLDELMQIAHLMLEQQQYTLSDEAEDAFKEYLERRMKQPRFANGRSVRNALERARLRQASRIVNSKGGQVSKADLLRIEADDILKSRVFSDEEDGAVPEPQADSDSESKSNSKNKKSNGQKD